jgi:hypothetical protein
VGKDPDRGYVAWKPQKNGDARKRLEIAQTILAEYEDYLPLTVRQVYYRAIGAHGRPKTKPEYENFVYALKRARRARLIPFSHLRDDGEISYVPSTFEGVPDFLEVVERLVESYERDRQAGQPAYIEVHCETAGMVDQLRPVTEPYSIPVYGSGGQLSLTSKFGTAHRAIAREVPTLIFHLGDADKWGHAITENAIEDPAAFVAAHRPDIPLTGKRLALTSEQIEEYDLPAAPDGKPGYQLEAIAPDVIVDILGDAIESQLDRVPFEHVVNRERVDQDELRELIGQVG